MSWFAVRKSRRGTATGPFSPGSSTRSRSVTSPSSLRPSASSTSSSGAGQNVAAPRTTMKPSSPTIITSAVASDPAVSQTQDSPWAASPAWADRTRR